MSDTTIATLLEELREVDETTWVKIQYGVVFGKGLDESRVPYESMGAQMAHDHLQGCIQWAILEKGWKYVVSNDRARQPYGQIGIPISNVRTEYQHRNYAVTPAAAILAAYIEAVRAM